MGCSSFLYIKYIAIYFFMSLLKKSSFSVGQLLWPFYIKFQCFCFSLFLKFYLSLPLVLFFLCNTYLLNNIIFFSTLWSFLFICLLYYLPTPKRIGKMYPCCSSTRELAREYNFIDRFFFFFGHHHIPIASNSVWHKISHQCVLLN